MICGNIGINKNGNLTFAGQDTVELAEKYSTPLYLIDENKVREKMRIYVEAINKYFPSGSMPLYASKALCFKKIYKIASEENMGIDVVSSGELYTVLKAGFPMEKVFEAYVAKNLKKRLNQAGWDVSIQDKGYYLFDTLNGEKYQKFALRPDLVITRPDESIIILDTKWKSLINNKKANYGISQADMYQMYAYAKKYQASEVWLLYPMNEEMRNTEPILFDSGDGVRVSVFLVDVAQIEESLEKLFLAFSSK